MPTRIHTLHVNFTGISSHRSYPIIIGRDLLADAGFYEDMIGDRPVVLVSNDQVGPLYASQVHQGLGEARHVTDVILPDGEAFKNIDTLDGIFTAALKDRHERRSVFMALGGGVIGDMTGFAAACFRCDEIGLILQAEKNQFLHVVNPLLINRKDMIMKLNPLRGAAKKVVEESQETDITPE